MMIDRMLFLFRLRGTTQLPLLSRPVCGFIYRNRRLTPLTVSFKRRWIFNLGVSTYFLFVIIIYRYYVNNIYIRFLVNFSNGFAYNSYI